MVDNVVLTLAVKVCPRSLGLAEIVRMISLNSYVMDFRSVENGGPKFTVMLSWLGRRYAAWSVTHRGEKYDGCSPLPRETP